MQHRVKSYGITSNQTLYALILRGTNTFCQTPILVTTSRRMLCTSKIFQFAHKAIILMAAQMQSRDSFNVGECPSAFCLIAIIGLMIVGFVYLIRMAISGTRRVLTTLRDCFWYLHDTASAMPHSISFWVEDGIRQCRETVLSYKNCTIAPFYTSIYLLRHAFRDPVSEARRAMVNSFRKLVTSMSHLPLSIYCASIVIYEVSDSWRPLRLFAMVSGCALASLLWTMLKAYSLLAIAFQIIKLSTKAMYPR